MLLIKANIGQTLRLFDKDKKIEIGQITRLKPHPTHPRDVLLGFELVDSILILRDSLLDCKETDRDVSNTRDCAAVKTVRKKADTHKD